MHKMSKTHLGWSKFLSYFSHFKFLHKDKKKLLGFRPNIFIILCGPEKFFTKEATIHQTTANSYQQWEQHNIWAKFLMPFMDYGKYKMALSTTVKV